MLRFRYGAGLLRKLGPTTISRSTFVAVTNRQFHWCLPRNDVSEDKVGTEPPPPVAAEKATKSTSMLTMARITWASTFPKPAPVELRSYLSNPLSHYPHLGTFNTRYEYLRAVFRWQYERLCKQREEKQPESPFAEEYWRSIKYHKVRMVNEYVYDCVGRSNTLAARWMHFVDNQWGDTGKASNPHETPSSPNAKKNGVSASSGKNEAIPFLPKTDVKRMAQAIDKQSDALYLNSSLTALISLADSKGSTSPSKPDSPLLSALHKHYYPAIAKRTAYIRLPVQKFESSQREPEKSMHLLVRSHIHEGVRRPAFEFMYHAAAWRHLSYAISYGADSSLGTPNPKSKKDVVPSVSALPEISEFLKRLRSVNPQPTSKNTKGKESNPSKSKTNKSETNKSQTNKSQTNTPQTNKPQTNTPQTNTPQTNTPQTNAPQTNAPQINKPDANKSKSEASTGNKPVSKESKSPKTKESRLKWLLYVKYRDIADPKRKRWLAHRTLEYQDSIRNGFEKISSPLNASQLQERKWLYIKHRDVQDARFKWWLVQQALKNGNTSEEKTETSSSPPSPDKLQRRKWLLYVRYKDIQDPKRKWWLVQQALRYRNSRKQNAKKSSSPPSSNSTEPSNPQRPAKESKEVAKKPEEATSKEPKGAASKPDKARGNITNEPTRSSSALKPNLSNILVRNYHTKYSSGFVRGSKDLPEHGIYGPKVNNNKVVHHHAGRQRLLSQAKDNKTASKAKNFRSLLVNLPRWKQKIVHKRWKRAKELEAEVADTSNRRGKDKPIDWFDPEVKGKIGGKPDKNQYQLYQSFDGQKYAH